MDGIRDLQADRHLSKSFARQTQTDLIGRPPKTTLKELENVVKNFVGKFE